MIYPDKRLNYGRKIINKFLNTIPFDSMLDIGAGKGQDIFIAEKINAKAKKYAIELDNDNFIILKERGISVFKINIEHDLLPLEDRCIDVAIANQILEHTKELFWIFHEISRVLKVGGHLIVGVPNLASLHNRLLLLLGKQPTCIKSGSAHIRGFTKSDLIRFAKIGHLDLVDFKGSNFYPFPSLLAKPLSKMFPSASVSAFFDFKKTRPYKNEYINTLKEAKLATNYYCGAT